jgi:CO dehydrogenase/acetyl-CoA synthase epsilon subunit
MGSSEVDVIIAVGCTFFQKKRGKNENKNFSNILECVFRNLKT